jgi:hypothetical protein
VQLIDPSTADPIDVRQVDGVTVARLRDRRDDVAAVNLVRSDHGFEILVPAGAGRRQVCVRHRHRVGQQRHVRM